MDPMLTVDEEDFNTLAATVNTAFASEHNPIYYRGRMVCTCGDFNCASLDHPTIPKN